LKPTYIEGILIRIPLITHERWVREETGSVGCYLQVLYVFPQLAVEGMAAEGGAVAEDDDLHAGTGDGHVHAAEIAQEADLALIVAAHKGDDDDVALLSLEAIDGVHGDEAAEWLEELALLDEPAQQLHLGAIG